MATANTNIKINIVEPGSSTPVDPTPIDPVDPSDTTNTTNTTTYTSSSTDVSVPDTGLFTHGIGGTEATIITISTIALLLTIIATIVTVLYKKHIRQGKVTKLVRTIEQTKTIIKSKKRISSALSAIALLASVGTLAILLANSNKTNTNAMEGGTELTVDVNSEDLTIEVGDTPVFAYLPVELTVEEATTSGYILSAYAENTNLVSTTDESNIIPMVAINEEDLSQYVSLTDNTWGLSLEQPQDQNSEVYTTLSTDQDVPTILKSIDDYSETNANDKTTIYYGFYITPDTPKGTYEGSNITYTALTNPPVATVTFDGNGLYFNDDESQTTNTAKYTVSTTDDTEKYSHTPNITDEGVQEGNIGYKGTDVVDEVITIPGAANVHIELTYGGGLVYGYEGGWASLWQGSHPNYTAQSDYGNDDSIKNCGGGDVTNGKYSGGDTNTTVECDVTGDSVTFAYYSQGGGPGSGPTYGYYAVVTGYDADGNIIYLPENNIVSGDYLIPSSEAYSRFLGWSKTQEATAPEYITEKDIETSLTLTPGETTTLYAKWEPAFTISYNGNGADTTTNMDQVEQYTTDLTSTEKQVDLLASNFTKSGHGFVGWSTDQNAWEDLTDDDESNNPTIYGPNQMITVDPSASTKLTLYAVWAPAETDNSGNPISLQDWQGCSALTPTTYSTETGALTVGKNTVTALTDSRDGNIYTIARLADGNCWMTENLRLGNNPELSQQNTNNPSLPLTNNYTEQTTSNSLSATSNDWCTDYNSAPCYNQSKLNTKNTALTTTSPAFNQDFTSSAHSSNFDTSLYSYSSYYNWYSATAGNGKQETGSGTTVAGDICPTGWMLPIGDQTSANGSFSRLDTSMGGTGSYQGSTKASNRWRSFPNNFIYSGYWYNSSPSSRGNTGYYWASTASSTSSAYYLNLYSNSMNFYSGTKNGGHSVRCVAPIGTTITFDGNGNDSGEMAKQKIGENTTAPLSTNMFTKKSHRFTGWNTERDGSGTSYTDGQDYTAEEGLVNITLYAQWEEAPYMQDIASWGNTLSEGDSIEVADKRDGKIYWVAKLADGNIWMTQNLDLDIEAGRTYTSADTDLANSSIDTTWTPTSSTYPTGTTTWNYSTTTPESYDPGNLYWNGNVTTSYSGTLSNRTTTDPSATSGGTHYHVGNYYNWTAAVAMNDSSSYIANQQDVNQSICPAGWRLPTYNGDKSYPRLKNAQGFTSGTSGNIQSAPTYFVYGGSWGGSSYNYNVGYNGYYWPSVVSNSSYSYLLVFDANGSLGPQYSGTRHSGFSLRCVAR